MPRTYEARHYICRSQTQFRESFSNKLPSCIFLSKWSGARNMPVGFVTLNMSQTMYSAMVLPQQVNCTIVVMLQVQFLLLGYPCWIVTPLICSMSSRLALSLQYTGSFCGSHFPDLRQHSEEQVPRSHQIIKADAGQNNANNCIWLLGEVVGRAANLLATMSKAFPTVHLARESL